MDDFRLIYKILRILQKSMDCEEIDREILSAERLELSVPKWSRIMAMLLNEGYITGGQTWNAFDCGYPRVAFTRPEITLKGQMCIRDRIGILGRNLLRNRKVS